MKNLYNFTCEELSSLIGCKVRFEDKEYIIGSVYLYVNSLGVKSCRLRFKNYGFYVDLEETEIIL